MEAESSQPHSVETFYRLMAWLHEHRKPLLIGLGAVAAVGLVVGIMAWNKAQNAANADAKLFDLPVSSPQNDALLPPAPSAYFDIAKQYPDTSAAEYAELLGAESLFLDGNYAESERAFSEYAVDHPDSPLIAQAKMGVAASLEAEGKTADALQKYQGIVTTYVNELNVTEPAKLTMARLYEQENRPDQALNLYGDLSRSQNAYDPWASEARERGELLLAKHPELRKAEQTQTQAPSPLNIAQPATGQSTAPAPAASAPAPSAAPANQGLNLLNFPASTSNAPAKK